MSDTPDLSALIGSRICHDLISPIGAIGNGVELLMMEGRAGPEVALIAESVAAANAQIDTLQRDLAAAEKAAQEAVVRENSVTVTNQNSTAQLNEARSRIDARIAAITPVVLELRRQGVRDEDATGKIRVGVRAGAGNGEW